MTKGCCVKRSADRDGLSTPVARSGTSRSHWCLRCPRSRSCPSKGPILRMCRHRRRTLGARREHRHGPPATRNSLRRRQPYTGGRARSAQHAEANQPVHALGRVRPPTDVAALAGSWGQDDEVLRIAAMMRRAPISPRRWIRLPFVSCQHAERMWMRSFGSPRTCLPLPKNMLPVSRTSYLQSAQSVFVA